VEDLNKHYLISGRVQGVGFRAFTARIAGELGVVGWVRNRADGSVECVAVGSNETLAKFEARLRQGPPHGAVENVEVTNHPPSVRPHGFEVRK